MKVSLTKGLTPDVAKEIGEEFARALTLRKRLGVVLNEKIDATRRNSLRKSGYENPSWAFSQADDIGYMRALTEIIDLLDIK
jgi:hypothetical protein